ncbi:DUF6507 family protein [Streptomyces sp. H10-C2]|uniref:DUF6507 family protein n=1 Tax=unclassified Streptomyces TaxID=2593676 RepID=UPI0024BAF994|nr:MULTISPECIES: DUF6507 family protein [unclassified Streptomyces]MDJ0345625.1 DUF6507 family protein [Streptomyces sp. PH10-H1]MDJ0372990.1 DUF6507 family protein [Streptomyces sp. H10-C2]
MTAWDITQSGVQTVLKNAATAAEGLSTAGKDMEKTLPSAAKSAGTVAGPHAHEAPTGVIEAALGEFLMARQKDLVYVAVRTANSLNGAATATNWYTQGNLAMAANAQATAVQEPVIVLSDKPAGGRP